MSHDDGGHPICGFFCDPTRGFFYLRPAHGHASNNNITPSRLFFLPHVPCLSGMSKAGDKSKDEDLPAG